MDTAVSVEYGSYTLEYNCHIYITPRPQCNRGQTAVFLVCTVGSAFVQVIHTGRVEQ